MLTRITSIFEVRALVEGITKEGGGGSGRAKKGCKIPQFLIFLRTVFVISICSSCSPFRYVHKI